MSGPSSSSRSRTRPREESVRLADVELKKDDILSSVSTFFVTRTSISSSTHAPLAERIFNVCEVQGWSTFQTLLSHHDDGSPLSSEEAREYLKQLDDRALAEPAGIVPDGTLLCYMYSIFEYARKRGDLDEEGVGAQSRQVDLVELVSWVYAELLRRGDADKRLAKKQAVLSAEASKPERMLEAELQVSIESVTEALRTRFRGESVLSITPSFDTVIRLGQEEGLTILLLFRAGILT